MTYFYWLFKERKLLIDVQREVEDTHKKLYSLEAELSALKEERESLQLKLKEEKGRISLLDQQKRSLQATLDENKKKEVCSFLLDNSKIIYNWCWSSQLTVRSTAVLYSRGSRVNIFAWQLTILTKACHGFLQCFKVVDRVLLQMRPWLPLSTAFSSQLFTMISRV